MLVLRRADVEELLDLDRLIEALGPAMADLSAGRASMPPRGMARVDERHALLGQMAAYLHTSDVLAAKLVSVFPGNAEKGLETHQAIVVLFDAMTGTPSSLIDGTSVTAIRTGAASALATRILARDDARVLAILGTGVQARSHIAAVPRVRGIQEIRIAGRSFDAVEALAAECGGTPAKSYEEAVVGADIVCACTHSPEPVVRREWVRPGMHITTVGFTTGPEVEPDLFGEAAVFVDLRDAAIGPYPSGAVDITAAVDKGILDRDAVAEIGEVIEGTRPGRSNDGQVTIYRSVGVAVQDAIAAKLVVDAARERGSGTAVDL